MIVAICSTRNWYFYVATEIYALFKHNEVAKVYLFIEDDKIPYLKDKRIEFININKTKGYISNQSPNYNTKYSKLSYVRCYFSKLLNEDKILYLDADAIVVDNIKELWNLDINNKALAGIHEGGEWSKHLGVAGMDDKYINSGVLLMNLDFIRKERIDDAMINLLNTNRYAYPDQDVINLACKDKIRYISNIYNSTETTGIVDNAKIIHYIRERKGWIPTSPRSEIWYRYYLEMLERSNGMVKIECIVTYDDLQLNRRVTIGEKLDVSKERAEYLVNERGLAKVVEVIPEEIKLEEVKEEVPVEAPVEVEEVEPKKPVAKKRRK